MVFCTFASAGGQQAFLQVLVQLIVVVACARVFAVLARRVRQPAVVGEIIGGLLLGPSCFGALAPELSKVIFSSDVEPVFEVLKELGLMLLLFIVGMEFEFSHLRQLGRAALFISLIGIVLPFALGVALAPLMQGEVHPAADVTGLALFLGAALTVTALPVLGRIMMELNITKTRLGTVTIAAAAVDDTAAWILLAAIVGAVEARFDLAPTLLMIGLTVAFLVGMLVLVRPLLLKLLDWYFARTHGRLEPNGLAAVLVLLMLCGLATLKIGIFAIFGAFILGVCVSGHQRLHHALGDSFRHFVSAFFLPIFFTHTGLRTDLGGLGGTVPWLLCGLLILAAIVGKVGGCAVVARWSGFSWREASCIGVMMNARGLIALIVISVGRDHGIINDALFTMLVLMAIVTTVITTPLLLWLNRGTELEPWIRESGFVRKPAGEI